MTEIIPAIIPESFDDLRNHLARVRGLVSSVQIDFCDGQFVKNRSWPFHNEDRLSWEQIISESEGLPFWEEFSFEADCMVREPEKFLIEVGRIGFSRAIVHFTSTKDIDAAIAVARNFEMDIGLAVGRGTSLKKLAPWVKKVDFIQVMGIEHIGAQGEPFDALSLDQLKELRAQYPTLTIGVDGGVSLETAPELIDAGANRLVSGSAIFGSGNIKKTIQEFQNLSNT